MHTKTKQQNARLSLAGAARRLIGAAVVAATLAACGGVGAGGTGTAWLMDHRGFGGPGYAGAGGAFQGGSDSRN